MSRSDADSDSAAKDDRGLRELPVLDGPPPASDGEGTGDVETLRRRLSRTMLRTATEQALIEDGDRILVAVSGGKDSYTLLDLLTRARAKAPVDFELVAFHVDQGQPGYDGRPLARWLEARGGEWVVHREDTYSIVLQQSGGGASTFCAPCSRLRRGVIYTHAERLGCNKIALGHHREDTLETLLLNLFWGGKLQAMPPRYTTNDGRFAVVRPLLECAEADIARYAHLMEFPILPCNLCGSQDGLKRDRVTAWLAAIEKEHPDVRRVMMAALGNVRPSHLLDREVAAAWEEAEGRFAPRR